MKHHTKQLGDLGVLKAQLDLFEKGYIVAVPLTEHAPFDLIVYKDYTCYTIQVKARTIDSSGVLNIKFRNTWASKNGNHISSVDKKAINYYCIYCPDTDKCYYLNPDKFQGSVKLRIYPPKNNAIKNINMADDFLNLKSRFDS